MKMGKVEKLFVNSDSHSQQVSHHAERLLTMVNFEAGQTYLDVGCGNGAAPIYLARHYQLEVTGIDVDPDQIRIAQEHSAGLPNVRFMTVDGGQLPFEDAEFDLVFTNKVTHHIPNWEEAVREMLRVLKPGGYFIYSDLVFPGWVAAVGKTVAANLAGFPSGAALDSLIEQHRLVTIHRSKQMTHYEGIFQKQ